MLHRTLDVLAATIVATLALPAAPAVAGSGCHEGVTTGTGTAVSLAEACFTPTTLRIEPGETVTFTNEDPIVHNVGGNTWGHFDDLSEGDSFRTRFDEAGIFPYACSYHPGMTGAIVVGDGTGAGNGETVSEPLEVSQPSPEVVVETAPASNGADGGSSAIGWVGGGAIGLAAGALGTAALRRRGRRAPGS